MSALVGLWYLDDRPVDASDLQRMVACLAHRGPDGAGTWRAGPVGLGHQMLWTTPESHGERLPLVDRSGDLVLTSDARIDNRDELLAALNLPPGEGWTDADLILAAYRAWGERCPERLLGDFAFVVWDRRNRRLFCARDPFGVRPFYYHASRHLFAFASEIKALLTLPEVPRGLNPARIADYLVPNLQDRTITYYEGILRLPPAHWLRVEAGRVVTGAYWALDPTREVRLPSPGAYAEAYRERFTEAVRCRLRSAYPVGSELSGGLDSSSIVVTARELLGAGDQPRLHTFSCVYDEVTECDERPFIQAVTRGGGLEPHFLHPDRMSPLADVERLLRHLDEPFWIPNFFMFWNGVYPAAHEQGVRVLFSGEDGDTVISHGYDLLTELAAHGRWLALFREIKGFTDSWDQPPWRPFWSRVRNDGIRPRIPEALLRWRRRQKGRPEEPEPVPPLLNPDFAARVDLAERLRSLEPAAPTGCRHSRGRHWMGLTGGMIPYLHEIDNKAAAAFGIELRFPFFDRRLVEFCLAIPTEQKLHRGWTRVVARRAMEGRLPAEIQWRPDKADLSPNFIRGFLRYEHDAIRSVVDEEAGGIGEYVDMAELRRSYQRYVGGEPGYGDDALVLWKAVTLALWLRTLDARPVGASA